MQGLITETELDEADHEFPGIAALYASLDAKPRTFLELVSLFDHWSATANQREPGYGTHVRCVDEARSSCATPANIVPTA